MQDRLVWNPLKTVQGRIAIFTVILIGLIMAGGFYTDYVGGQKSFIEVSVREANAEGCGVPHTGVVVVFKVDHNNDEIIAEQIGDLSPDTAPHAILNYGIEGNRVPGHLAIISPMDGPTCLEVQIHKYAGWKLLEPGEVVAISYWNDSYIIDYPLSLDMYYDEYR